MWLWLEFRAYLGSPRRVAQDCDAVTGPQEIRMFGAEIAIKHEENAEFENAQIEVPVRGGVGGYAPPLHPPQQEDSTRLATQGRGGFNRYRAFRRAGSWATCCK